MKARFKNHWNQGGDDYYHLIIASCSFGGNGFSIHVLNLSITFSW